MMGSVCRNFVTIGFIILLNIFNQKTILEAKDFGFDTNLNPNNVFDVIQGKRNLDVTFGENGLQLNAGYTDQEKIMIGVGIVAGIALIGLICCCCCCGTNRRNDTGIVHVHLANSPSSTV